MRMSDFQEISIKARPQRTAEVLPIVVRCSPPPLSRSRFFSNLYWSHHESFMQAAVLHIDHFFDHPNRITVVTDVIVPVWRESVTHISYSTGESIVLTVSAFST